MNKAIITILLISTLILIAGCVEDSCNGITEQTLKDDCYLENAVEAKSISTCNKITSDIVKNSCIAEIGIKKSNLNICGKLEGKTKDYSPG
jgi:hypothetical protein